MGDIKSAYEIAMEKVGKIGKASNEELTKWKYTPEGEKLGARYIKEEFDIIAELNKFDAAAAKFVSEGAVDTLMRNIAIPKSEAAKKNQQACYGRHQAHEKRQNKSGKCLFPDAPPVHSLQRTRRTAAQTGLPAGKGGLPGKIPAGAHAADRFSQCPG